MKINILTLFPEFFESPLKTSILKKAILKEKADVNLINFREYSKENNKRVDFPPYGGGNGMIISPTPIFDCLKENNLLTSSYKILLSPEGEQYTQNTAFDLAKKENITLICGHYEGVDKRVDSFIDKKISIGDYILTGGETSALVLLDSIIRLLDGVIKKESYSDESFSNNLLEYDQYTYPRVFNQMEVPEVLLSGHHQNVDNFRILNSIEKTKILRPDLFEKHQLSDIELKLLYPKIKVKKNKKEKTQTK